MQKRIRYHRTYVQTVEKALVAMQILLDTRELTQERDPINVQNVRKALLRNRDLLITYELTTSACNHCGKSFMGTDFPLSHQQIHLRIWTLHMYQL